jgi:aminoglycoside phosphotransferase (APT) family kinase protein
MDVLVKIPVGPVEYRWTTQLSQALPGENGDWSHLPTPKVLASGTVLNGYDLGWLVIERLEGQTLTHGWSKQCLEDLLRTVAVMQARAERLDPVSGRPSNPDWEALISRSRQLAHDGDIPEAQRWNDHLRKVQKHLPKLAARWATRPVDSWCHGDVHPGNAMRRRPDPAELPPQASPCVLIDLALVHPGCWVEDAVYLERQFWGRPDQLFGVHPVSLLARYRRELGLRTDGDYGTLANLRRLLMASCAPVYFAEDGHPRYLHAALETIDRLLPQVPH